MKQVIIENSIINSPFNEPTCHFKFTNEGITNEEVDGRRTSSYFVPIAKPKKKGAQQLQLVIPRSLLRGQSFLVPSGVWRTRGTRQSERARTVRGTSTTILSFP